jgi:hypothetical protein
MRQHECEKCHRRFPIERHERMLVDGVSGQVVLPFTGLNMVYSGSMNREYACCPHCNQVEHQFSAEARDQSEDTEELLL